MPDRSPSRAWERRVSAGLPRPRSRWSARILAAEICALYLAGAGVGRLTVSPSLAARVAGANSEVRVIEGTEAGVFAVRLIAPPAGLHVEPGVDPLLSGARAARWALARLLGGDA